MPDAWVLNLDAELELLRPQGYYPKRATLAACAKHQALALLLLGPSDVLVPDRLSPVAGSLAGYRGQAWCPTPSALRALEKGGATLSPTPSLRCLQRVNHRQFCAQLGQTLPAAEFIQNPERALAALEAPPDKGWMAKRAFGFAAREVRRIPLLPRPDDVRWLRDAIRLGGVQLEPWVDLLHEYSLHGYLDPSGSVRWGRPCLFLVGSVRAFVPAAAVPNHETAALLPREESSLQHEAERVANALHAEHYFGPFGIDAFTYVRGGTRHFNPRSEVNARYTLAYPAGMGLFESGA